jgi:hypothetical protein
MLHTCVERFDAIGGRGNILGWDREVNKALARRKVVLLRVNFLPAFLVSSAVLRAADAGAKCVDNLARRLAIVKLARGRVVPQLAAAASSALRSSNKGVRCGAVRRGRPPPPTRSARGLFVWAKQPHLFPGPF